MRSPSEFSVALIDLLAIEARSLRRGTAKGALGVGLVLAGALLVLGGLALGLWGLFMALAGALSKPAAAMILCVITLFVSGVLVWIGMRVAS